jgi:hypothetical protein
MLKTLIISTYVAAKALLTMRGSVDPKISDIIVLATPSTPMPAVTLKQRTIQSR